MDVLMNVTNKLTAVGGRGAREGVSEPVGFVSAKEHANGDIRLRKRVELADRLLQNYT